MSMWFEATALRQACGEEFVMIATVVYGATCGMVRFLVCEDGTVIEMCDVKGIDAHDGANIDLGPHPVVAEVDIPDHVVTAARTVIDAKFLLDGAKRRLVSSHEYLKGVAEGARE